MKIEKVEVIPSTRSDKRAMAVIYFEGTDKTKRIHFGSPTAFTYFDGATVKKKENYLKRHSELNEDWTSPLKAGFWARWVLWSFRKVSTHVIKKLIKRKSDINIPLLKIDLPENKKPKSIMDYRF